MAFDVSVVLIFHLPTVLKCRKDKLCSLQRVTLVRNSKVVKSIDTLIHKSQIPFLTQAVLDRHKISHTLSLQNYIIIIVTIH